MHVLVIVVSQLHRRHDQLAVRVKRRIEVSARQQTSRLQRLKRDTPELRAKFVASVPLGRMSRPDDIAAAALYLASPEADLITGVALEVDGGRCI